MVQILSESPGLMHDVTRVLIPMIMEFTDGTFGVMVITSGPKSLLL